MRPTTMLFRNLASMDVEETLRANPLDGVVLLAGCDKTTPALLMGAASVDLPTILLSGGPMLNGRFSGRDVGSGTDAIRLADDLNIGRIGLEEFLEAEIGMNRSAGFLHDHGHRLDHGLALRSPGHRAPPERRASPPSTAAAPCSPSDAGKRIVELVEAATPMSAILTRAAFENAIVAQRRHRRLDQRRRASARARRPARRRRSPSTTGTGSAATCPASST